jgi:cardiolipin synthase
VAVEIGVLLHFLIVVTFLVRVMTRPHRDPPSRIAWVAVIATVPFLGPLIYLLFGEVNIGHRRKARIKAVLDGMRSLLW